MTSAAYWDAGPPDWDPRHFDGAAPTMDVVASYGGNNNQFIHNDIAYGNTAGIYLDADVSGVRERNATVWDNVVRFYRQHGIDIGSTENVTVLTNVVQYIELAPISLGGVQGGTIKYNTVSNGGQRLFADPTYYIGAVWFLAPAGGSTVNVTVTENDIHGDGNHFAVSFRDGDNCTNNAVTGNDLWRGTIDYVRDISGANVTSPNTLY